MTSEHQYVISFELLKDKDPHTFFSAIDAGNPASKACGDRGASSSVQLLHHRPTLPVMDKSPTLVSVLALL